MPLYESVLVFRQDLTEAQVKEKAEKFTKIVKDLKGKVVNSEFWGLKTLAYVIRKNKKAHYVMLNIELPGEAVAEYERLLRIDEDVIRFLNIATDEFQKGPSIMMKNNDEGDE